MLIQFQSQSIIGSVRSSKYRTFPCIKCSLYLVGQHIAGRDNVMTTKAQTLDVSVVCLGHSEYIFLIKVLIVIDSLMGKVTNIYAKLYSLLGNRVRLAMQDISDIHRTGCIQTHSFLVAYSQILTHGAINAYSCLNNARSDVAVSTRHR